MKKIIATTLLLILSNILRAQDLANQQKAQKKILLEQIAALNVYIGYAQKGYKISRQGLDFIGDVKEGELNLHKEYFSSLKQVSLSVSGYYKVNEIIALQKQIMISAGNSKKQIKRSQMLHNKELLYIDRVFKTMIADCSKIISELALITESGKVTMKDDQRIRRIDELYIRMAGNYSFTMSFGNDAKSLAVSRKKELMDLKISRSINGLKK